ERGRLRLDGELPTNTDGGGLSSNHPGMRGLFLVIEAARQLRGEAVGPQVVDDRRARGGRADDDQHRGHRSR
ncbi:MAG TPA: acetyl-CoA acetyltransferase, partial [Actinomycetota bacterium]